MAKKVNPEVTEVEEKAEVKEVKKTVKKSTKKEEETPKAEEPAEKKEVKKTVKKLPFDQWADKLRSTFNPDSVVRIRVEIGIFKPGDNALVDTEVFKTTPKNVASDKQTTVLKDYPISAVYGKKLKRPENYTDVRGQVVSDYQDMLEKAWVYELRQKYTFFVNKDVLKTVNKH